MGFLTFDRKTPAKSILKWRRNIIFALWPLFLLISFLVSSEVFGRTVSASIHDVLTISVLVISIAGALIWIRCPYCGCIAFKTTQWGGHKIYWPSIAHHCSCSNHDLSKPFQANSESEENSARSPTAMLLTEINSQSTLSFYDGVEVGKILKRRRNAVLAVWPLTVVIMLLIAGASEQPVDQSGMADLIIRYGPSYLAPVIVILCGRAFILDSLPTL
jgi:hypothetical protein